MKLNLQPLNHQKKKKRQKQMIKNCVSPKNASLLLQFNIKSQSEQHMTFDLVCIDCHRKSTTPVHIAGVRTFVAV